MTSKYTYKGMDITMDVYDKIQSVVELLAHQDGLTFDDAYREFAGCRALAALQNPKTLMWSESPAFILGEYRRETSSRVVAR